jgi:hypothetical protein
MTGKTSAKTPRARAAPVCGGFIGLGEALTWTGRPETSARPTDPRPGADPAAAGLASRWRGGVALRAAARVSLGPIDRLNPGPVVELACRILR